MKILTLFYGLLVIAGLASCQTSQPATGPSGTVCESPGGSCVGIETGVLIPYSGNCSKYIVCQWGCGCDMECSGILHFNSELQVCDWPENAGCDSSNSTTAKPTTPGDGSGGSTPGGGSGGSTPGDGSGGSTPGGGSGGSTPGDGSGGSTPGDGSGGSTPGDGSGGVTTETPVTRPCDSLGGSCVGITTGELIPYSGNCSKFIACAWGCGTDMECPGILHFNSELQVCDWPENAGCDSSNSTTAKPTTPGDGSGGSTPGDGSGGSTPGGGSGGVTTETPVTRPCDSLGGSCVGITTGELIPYSGNCSKFIACAWGCGTDMECPGILQFNSELQVCDWPENAGCNSSNTTTAKPTTPGDGSGGSTPGDGSGGSTPGDGSGGSTPGDGSGGSTPGDGSGGSTPGDGSGGSTPGCSCS